MRVYDDTPLHRPGVMSRVFPAALPRRGLVVSFALIAIMAIAACTPAADGAGTQAKGPAAASSGQDSGVSIMLGLAKTAVDEKRLIAPAGANAFEFYLSALQLEPDNAAATAGLHELFEPAADDIERAINDNNLDEAQRELSLLREFDGTNYKLALLGGKLDAQRQIQVREDEARAAVIQSQATSSSAVPAQ
ncbi:protein TonB [Dyella marensis]|uniref:Protein TonB n=2 Tax=Rhodanobacteraceae TaxID=1775411 RepID=A0A1I2IR67_9GAMM|nr:protein TonB [Dyella marensis]